MKKEKILKNGSGRGAVLVASAAAPAGAPRPAAARAAARIAPLAGERRRRSWGSRTWI